MRRHICHHGRQRVVHAVEKGRALDIEEELAITGEAGGIREDVADVWQALRTESDRGIRKRNDSEDELICGRPGNRSRFQMYTQLTAVHVRNLKRIRYCNNVDRYPTVINCNSIKLNRYRSRKLTLRVHALYLNILGVRQPGVCLN